ncbi:hypothetical protein BGX24_007255 [Mortierella sp. AD032]|nr:hypothetical protein BGX24_007255 [Mortierella sp. AD032]
MGVLSVASIFKFDPENLFNGLRELGLSAGQAYDVAKAARAGGESLKGCIVKGFWSGDKRAWYPALQGARVCIRAGPLAKFKHIVYNAPCRHESEFQWGVCQLLREMGLDRTWEIEMRQQSNSRLQEHRQAEYIPPHAKASRDSPDEDSFPLMAKVKEFLESNQQVFLIIGDSGSGKSTLTSTLNTRC